MTEKELSTAVHNRMLAEQQDFKKVLLKMKPEEILNHAHEYAVREDILCAMLWANLSEDQALALLGEENPLKGIYEAYTRIEYKQIEKMNMVLEDYAESVTDDHARLRDLPVYLYSYEYAQTHNEIEKYRASYIANVECKEAIERAISQHYANNCMDSMASKQVIGQFGFDRTLYVLANTVQLKDWDARFSWVNKDWAKEIMIAGGEDGLRDHRWKFVVDKSHPGLTDMFLTMVRNDLEREGKRRSSVLEQLKTNLDTIPKQDKQKKQKDEVR